jgi:hypothetical protein
MTTLTPWMLEMSAFAALFAASLAVAQSPQTVRVRGTIEGRWSDLGRKVARRQYLDD